MAGERAPCIFLRCYGYKDKRGKWYGVCLVLNLAAEADSSASLRVKLNEMIGSYLETVVDTKDQESIRYLFPRRAPAPDWLRYYAIRFLSYVGSLKDQMTFSEVVPCNVALSLR